MNRHCRIAGLLVALVLAGHSELLACGDKLLVGSRGTRYQRPKHARAASVLIYSDPSTGLPAALQDVPVETALKREGHRFTSADTLEKLAALVAGGRYEVILVASSVAAAVEKLVQTDSGAPVVVALCVKENARVGADGKRAPCSVKTPARERTLLEAIDRAVQRYDRSSRKSARG